MDRDYFWLTGEQFSKLKPHLPTDTRGKARVDDRRVISGIIHVIKSGGRWVDAPAAYGPRKTLYNRFHRWANKGIWTGIFQALASAGGHRHNCLSIPRLFVPIAVRRAEKGGTQPGNWQITRRAHHQDPRPD